MEQDTRDVISKLTTVKFRLKLCMNPGHKRLGTASTWNLF